MHLFKNTFFRFLLTYGAFLAPVQAFPLVAVQIHGLHGISRETVLSYLPVKVGENFNQSQSTQLINALYATGFFNNVRLKQQNHTLIIDVVERPIISRVLLTGNKELPKDKLNELLEKIGLAQGRFFDQSVLEQFVTQLRTQYDLMGKYAARVTPHVTQETNNRVAISINISEGMTAQVAGISIVGNHAFSDKAIQKALPLTTPKPWSFLTNSDRYNTEQLSATANALQSYYLDRGYLKFKINSTQVTLTPDKKQAYLIFRITEGPIYTFGDHHVAGRLLISESKLKNLFLALKPGTPFSRQTVVDIQEHLKSELSELGYLFATVNTVPEVNEKDKTVSLTFYVDPGQQVYVRHINIHGNVKTQDEVFRRLLRQQEASLMSEVDVRESVRQMQLSGLLQGMPQITPIPVPGYSDQVDLDVQIAEAHAAQALFSFGYGTNGPVINLALNQTNVFGTGNQLAVNFNNTRAATIYNVSYLNPYYTLDGIQRGFDFFFQRATPSNLNTTTYSTNTYGGDIRYVIPFDAQGDALTLQGGLQRLELNLPDDKTIPYHGRSREVQKFVEDHGTKFNQFLLSVGWVRNGFDRLIFPEKGLTQKANLQLAFPVGGEPLQYYRANYGAMDYYPLTQGFILQGRLSLGYGDGFGGTKGLPFFANYYAGGIGMDGQVRGYEVSSLGPKDSLGYPLGGNVMTVGSVALIVPMPVSVADRVRTSLFVDAGNVYSTQGVNGGTASGPLRYSVGLGIDWRVPVFNVTLSFSLAKAINPQPNDQTQLFQFNIGTGF